MVPHHPLIPHPVLVLLALVVVLVPALVVLLVALLLLAPLLLAPLRVRRTPSTLPNPALTCRLPSAWSQPSEAPPAPSRCRAPLYALSASLPEHSSTGGQLALSQCAPVLTSPLCSVLQPRRREGTRAQRRE